MMRVILSVPRHLNRIPGLRQLLSIVYRGRAVRYFVQVNGATRHPCLLVHSTTVGQSTISSARAIAYKAFG